MKPTVKFAGVFPILATPFDARGYLDLESLTRLVSFVADAGANGVTILGVLGEADRLLDVERREVIRTAVAAAAGRLPVVVGVSHRGTFAAAQLARMAEEHGAAAVMLSPPPEPGIGEERLAEIFRQVAGATSLPLVIQDHPASCGVQLSVPLLLRLATELPQVACIKEEAVPTAPKIRALRSVLPRPVGILTGLGALYGQFDLEAGSDGFMTGFAFPEVLAAMQKAWAAGRAGEAQSLYRNFLPLIVFEQQPGVAVRKELLKRRGLLASNRVRHPAPQLDPTAAAQLDKLLEQVLPGVDLTRPLQL